MATVHVTLPDGKEKDYYVQAFDGEDFYDDEVEYWLGEGFRMELMGYMHDAYKSGFDAGTQFGRLTANQPPETLEALAQCTRTVNSYWDTMLSAEPDSDDDSG